MILGLGSDLVDIRRIDRLWRLFGPRFTERLFTKTEHAAAAQHTDPIPTYAKRFAAKEACAKALGTGMSEGVFFKDIGVENLPNGRPVLALTGGALAQLNRITPPGMTAMLHLSLTDEPPYAQAFVLIEARV